jgi:hypothetical protein
MPTTPLATRYEDDLRLLASRWRQVGVVLLGIALWPTRCRPPAAG